MYTNLVLSGPYLGRGTGRHMTRGIKSQGRQNILAKLILKMMYLMKKNQIVCFIIL
jgi:hypothetical protein